MTVGNHSSSQYLYFNEGTGNLRYSQVFTDQLSIVLDFMNGPVSQSISFEDLIVDECEDKEASFGGWITVSAL